MASALITGTSKGIGMETALAFARAGYQVHATMRNPSQSPALAETATREKLLLSVSALDVDSDQSVSKGIAQIQEEHGPIDVLVNNAGIEKAGSIEELPLADFRASMETNYFGAIRCIQAALPRMRERRQGCMINVTSVAGRIASPPLAPYNASKWALEALSEALASEMKPFNVRVAIVEPGIINTAMARRIGEVGPDSPYPHRERFANLFSAALQHAVSASVVATEILNIARNGTWQLRHVVGPDAAPLLEGRRQMTDEQWIDLHASDDETWYRSMGLDPALAKRRKN